MSMSGLHAETGHALHSCRMAGISGLREGRSVDITEAGLAAFENLFGCEFDFGAKFRYPLKAWIHSRYETPKTSKRWCAPRLRANSRWKSLATAQSAESASRWPPMRCSTFPR